MAKSGNTWFKIKRNKGRQVGFMHVRTNALATRKDHSPAAREPVKAREPNARVRTGFRFVAHGAGATARRAACHIAHSQRAWYKYTV
jgi:hypothetical protein